MTLTILICVMDAPGFAYQAVGLARALEARGHRAVCVSSPSVAQILARHGVERIAPPGADRPSFQLLAWNSVEATLLQLRHLRHAVRAARPDAIVASPLGYGPALAAESLAIPLVTIAGLVQLWEPGTWRYEEGSAAYLASRRALGVDTAPIEGFAPWLGDRCLLQSTRSLAGEPSSPRVDCVGDCSWDPPWHDADTLRWLDEAARHRRKLVYVQTGREFGKRPLLELLDEVAARLDVAFAVSTAHGDAEPSLSSDRVWARPFLSRAAVLPRCALVVTSGQPTTLLGALGHGLPCVLYYSGSGTEEAARACRDRGAALIEPLAGATPDGATELIARGLADRSLARAAATLGAELRALGGLPAVAAQLEQLAAPSLAAPSLAFARSSTHGS